MLVRGVCFMSHVHAMLLWYLGGAGALVVELLRMRPRKALLSRRATHDNEV